MGILLLILLTAASFTPFTSGYIGTRNPARPNSEGDRSQNSRRCVSTCQQQSLAAANRDLPEQAKVQYYHFSALNAEEATKACSIYGTLKECIASCGNSKTKELAEKSVDLFQYACNESNLLTSAGCLNRAYTEVGCDRGQCRGTKRKLEDYKRTPPTSAAAVGDYMNNACKHIKCGSSCPNTTVLRRCGMEKQRESEQFVRKSLQFVKFLMRTDGWTGSQAPECDRV